MPITSYLAHPVDGKKEDLVQALNSISNCEVVPSTNQDVVILVTDTKSKQEEETIKNQLETVASLKHLAMVSGFNTPDKN